MTRAGASAEHQSEVAGLAAPLHRCLALALALAAGQMPNYLNRLNVTTAGAFAEHRPEVAGLAAPLHRGLALALALAADGLRDPYAARQYVGHMLGAVARELAGLAGSLVS